MKLAIAKFVPLLLVAMIGLELGSGLYEARVAVPLWAGDPQGAYRFWTANPQYAQHSGERWWIFLTPLTGLVGLVTALTAGALPSKQARWVRIGSIGVVLMTIATFAYFVPAIMALQGPKVLELTPEIARQKGELWANLNWLRAAWFVAVWIVMLRAVSMREAV